MPVTSDPCILLGSDAPDALRDLCILRSAPRRALRAQATQALTAWARQIWQRPPPVASRGASGLVVLPGSIDAPVDIPAHFTIFLPTGGAMIKIFTDGSALLARRDTSDRGTPRLHFLPWIFALRGGKSAPVRVSCTNPTRHARQAELALRLPENASSRYLTDAAFAQICVKRTAARPSAADAFLRALEADVQKLAPLLDTMVPINPPHGDTIAFGCPPWRIPKTPYPGVWPWFLPHLDAAPESVEAVQEWAEAAATWLLGQSPAVSSAKLTVRARLPEDAGSGLPVDLELRRAPGLRDTLRPDALGLAPPSLPAGAPIPTGVQRNGGNGGAGLDRPVIATTSVDRATADLSGHTRLRLQMRFGPMPDRVCAALESEEPLAG